MLATPSLALVLAFVAVSAVGAPGCSKVVHAPAPVGKLGELAKTAFDHLPDSSNLLLGVSWTQLRASPFWKAVEPRLLGNPEIKDFLEHVKTVCAIDIVADLDAVLLSLPSDLDRTGTVALVKGRWDEDKIGNCIAAVSKDRGADEAMTFSKEDGYSVLKSSTDTMLLAWVTPDTFVIGPQDTGDKAALGAIVHPARALAKNAALTALVQRIDTSDAVWMLAPDGRFASVKDADEVKGVYAALHIDSAAHSYFGMRFDSSTRAELEARGGEEFLAEQRRNPTLKELLTDSRVFVADNDVVVEARVSATKVAELAERLARMDDGEWLLVLGSLEKLMGGI